MDRMLESEEAARRLGVKVATLYAYVSRGLLTSHPAPSGRRRSLFAAEDVEALARRSRKGRGGGMRLATVTTAITQLTEFGPRYRGTPATDLVAGGFEAAAELLWGGTGETAGSGFAAPGTDGAEGPFGGDGPVRADDRLRLAVVAAGARDPLRSDHRPPAVRRAARALVGTMVAALEPAVEVPPPAPVAHRLAAALVPGGHPGPALVEAVDGALVLMADHELATSTMAVRLAASTRADVYDAVLCGLATVAGPLHGGASQLAHTLLLDARRLGVEAALDETLRWQRVLPGFGHSVYTDGDPRFDALLARVEPLAAPGAVDLVHRLVATAEEHDIPAPNVDLALAALVEAADLPPDAGRTVFSVARVAGWVAHYLEELDERPLRYRTRAVYATH